MSKRREGMQCIRTLEREMGKLKVVRDELYVEVDKMLEVIKSMKYTLKHEKLSLWKKIDLKMQIMKAEKFYRKALKMCINASEKYYERKESAEGLIKQIKEQLELDKINQRGVTLSR